MNPFRYVAVFAGALTALSLLGATIASARSHISHQSGSHRHKVLHKRGTDRPTKHSPRTNDIAPAAFKFPEVFVLPRLQLPYLGPPLYRQVNERNRFFIAQVTSYTCGPSSLAMAISDHILGQPPTLTLVKQLTKETGTREQDGMPAWWTTVPNVATKQGLITSVYTFAVGDTSAMVALDAELLRGHSAFVHINNPRSKYGGGHFIYVAGKTVNGGYVIGDPDAPSNSELGHDKEVSRQDLEAMMVKPPRAGYYHGVPGFVAVWAESPRP